MPTTTIPSLTRADLTLYLVERAGGADMGGDTLLTLGRDSADREAHTLASGHAEMVTVTPLAWDGADETDALFMVDDADAVLADTFAWADTLGFDYEPGRCDVYALLLGVREAL